MLSKGSLVSRLLSLAWPVALARLGIMGMGVCDAMVVGQLAPKELAHQALGWAPTAVMLVASIGMLTGVQVLAARAIGAGRPEQAGGALQRGLVASLLSGLVAILFANWVGERVFVFFGVAHELVAPSARIMRVLMLSVPMHLCYVSAAFFVEAIERPLVSTWVMWIANVVNLALNLWLVPHWGALGSAWATFGARAFLAVSMLVWIYRLPDAARLGLRARCPSPPFRDFLAVGAAAAVSHAAESSAFSGMTIVAGRLGGHAVAAYQILLNLLAVVFMCALGLATATGVLTSQAVGRGTRGEATRVSWYGLGLNTAMLLVIAGLIVGFAPYIARAYTVDASVALLVVGVTPIAACAMLADGGQTVVASSLRALGDNWVPTASHLLAYVGVMPVLGLTLAEAQGLGVRGLLLAIAGASLLSVCVLMLRLRVLTSRAGGEPRVSS